METISLFPHFQHSRGGKSCCVAQYYTYKSPSTQVDTSDKQIKRTNEELKRNERKYDWAGEICLVHSAYSPEQKLHSKIRGVVQIRSFYTSGSKYW